MAALALGLAGGAQAGTVTVVTSFPKEVTQAYKQAFEKANPDIKLEILNRSTTASVAYVRETPAGQRPDVFWASAPDAFEVLAKGKLLEKVEPTSAARYVAFQTLLDPNRMPNQRTGILDWPYVEGLRLDEAMHPLTIMATGMYGETLPPQDGAPIRLVLPWKYGFKSIKSVVKITLVADEPPTTWNIQAPDEYGFYSNVNPNVPHPRWSQATERRIGEYGRRDTLLFNGYAEQVAHMYQGMDLVKNF